MKIVSHSIIVGAIAAAAVLLSTQIQIPTWALFLAWVGFFLFGPSLRNAGLALLHVVAGLILAVGLIAVSIELSPQFGDWALVGLVFLIAASLTLLEPFENINNIPAYYLGMIMVFASGLPPTLATVLHLIIPTVIGFGLGWLTVTLRDRITTARD